jgi:uncharacterized RDD family membrane protein YckC
LTDPMSERPSARASFGTRLVASLVDGVILIVAGGILGALLGSDGTQAIGTLLGLAYYVYLEGSPSGQTIGKRAMGIRVIDLETAGPIGYGRAAIRYFGRIVSGIACLLGYFWMLWDDQKQTWHDKFATCVVVPASDHPVEAWPG